MVRSRLLLPSLLLLLAAILLLTPFAWWGAWERPALAAPLTRMVFIALKIASSEATARAPVATAQPATPYVPRTNAAEVLAASRAREEREARSRERYAAGERGLDVNDMRGALERKGLRYRE